LLACFVFLAEGDDIPGWPRICSSRRLLLFAQMFERRGEGRRGRGAIGGENARSGIVGKGVYPVLAARGDDFRRFLGDATVIVSSLS
jgi:hypothetical protein